MRLLFQIRRSMPVPPSTVRPGASWVASSPDSSVLSSPSPMRTPLTIRPPCQARKSLPAPACTSELIVPPKMKARSLPSPRFTVQHMVPPTMANRSLPGPRSTLPLVWARLTKLSLPAPRLTGPLMMPLLSISSCEPPVLLMPLMTPLARLWTTLSSPLAAWPLAKDRPWLNSPSLSTVFDVPARVSWLIAAPVRLTTVFDSVAVSVTALLRTPKLSTRFRAPDRIVVLIERPLRTRRSFPPDPETESVVPPNVPFWSNEKSPLLVTVMLPLICPWLWNVREDSASMVIGPLTIAPGSTVSSRSGPGGGGGTICSPSWSVPVQVTVPGSVLTHSASARSAGRNSQSMVDAARVWRRYGPSAGFPPDPGAPSGVSPSCSGCRMASSLRVRLGRRSGQVGPSRRSSAGPGAPAGRARCRPPAACPMVASPRR
ncbi:hypothetical protein [Coralloluteibacterium thermophilus]|uniref:Uncharacterized protein n=1 Tax=Coralloluteibacterium thermophilum TaxID=2707049 RepID=A0ABV9NP33_9GAMM